MRKKALFIIISILFLTSCFNSVTQNNLDKQPNFKGVIKEIHTESIMVLVDQDQDEFKSSDLISVSLDVKFKDTMPIFKENDYVIVYYDGKIAESYPAQIKNVYAIMLVK